MARTTAQDVLRLKAEREAAREAAAVLRKDHEEAEQHPANGGEDMEDNDEDDYEENVQDLAARTTRLNDNQRGKLLSQLIEGKSNF